MYNVINIDIYTQGGEIGEILRFLTFKLDYNNYLSNHNSSHVRGSAELGQK